MAHPIAAIATGLVRSGIGILRMSGDGCIDLANRVFALYNGQALSSLPDRKLARGTLFDAQNRPIDEAMVFVSHVPHSYTGEDTVEFQCHGSPAVLTAGLSALLSNGFHQAGPGEFTKRAFLNGQMDLTQAEAVIDLIDAETADAAANAAGQVAGVLRKQLDPIYDSLMDICSHFHAVLDYPDEDIEPFRLQAYADTLNSASKKLDMLLSSCRRGNFIKNGVQTAILGAPNAGKSSLLNALAGFDRVIVTDIPGTTRDAVEQTVTLGRHLLRLLDTAGIRDTSDTVEHLGVERSFQAAQSCQLAFFVVDGSKPLTREDEAAMDAALQAPDAIAILNKQDLPCVIDPCELPFSYVIPVSCAKQAGLDLLEQALDMVFDDEAPCDGSILTNARQADAIAKSRASIEAARSSLRLGMTPDAVLVDVEAAMEALGEATGRVVREDITNRIFERFCVGK
ncbi:tRNA-5-carboxymethylaminomethyl-2-thiouridine(34) synthesis protein MnmE [Oscillospiraceae bacterium]|nr:tRNA-5-carboxymethylaminomethyl-2-thiouridine(34) synthesis protein MnmE [Oscillospiraceae bacterium]